MIGMMAVTWNLLCGEFKGRKNVHLHFPCDTSPAGRFQRLIDVSKIYKIGKKWSRIYKKSNKYIRKNGQKESKTYKNAQKVMTVT